MEELLELLKKAQTSKTAFDHADAVHAAIVDTKNDLIQQLLGFHAGRTVLELTIMDFKKFPNDLKPKLVEEIKGRFETTNIACGTHHTAITSLVEIISETSKMGAAGKKSVITMAYNALKQSNEMLKFARKFNSAKTKDDQIIHLAEISIAEYKNLIKLAEKEIELLTSEEAAFNKMTKKEPA